MTVSDNFEHRVKITDKDGDILRVWTTSSGATVQAFQGVQPGRGIRKEATVYVPNEDIPALIEVLKNAYREEVEEKAAAYKRIAEVALLLERMKPGDSVTWTMPKGDE